MTTKTRKPAEAGAAKMALRILHFATDYFLWLPIGGVVALVWSNAAPESYFRTAHRLAFGVNDIGMALFFALVAQEIAEAVMPGGMLHTWRRWLFPIVAATCAVVGAATVYLAYVHWQYEIVLQTGWPAATAIDLAFVYMLVRGLFGRHPATPFALLVAVAANAIGWTFVAAGQPLLHLRPEHLGLMVAALGIAGIMRVGKVQSFWPYLLVPGPIAWLSLYAMGMTPALALVPIVPFLQHTRRSALFEERPHSSHDSPTHLEHALKYPVHAVLFLFGLANAGVSISGYGTGTWALLAASLVGKPVGLLGGAGLALLIGLHLPRGLHWRELAVVSMATAGGFATALFFATAVYPIGPLLGELKLGVIASGVGVLLTLALAWAAGRGSARDARGAHAHHQT